MQQLPEFPPPEGERRPMSFRRVLLNTCQEEFEGAAAAREVRCPKGFTQLTKPCMHPRLNCTRCCIPGIAVSAYAAALMPALKANQTSIVSSAHHMLANMLGTYLFWTTQQDVIGFVCKLQQCNL